MDNNNRSGSSRINVPYEQELSKIAAMDDSIQPEVVGTASTITVLKKSLDLCDPPSPSTSEIVKKKRAMSVQEVLVQINNQKEEAI